MGGRQSWPFLLTPRGLVPEDYVVDGPIDLYPLFRRYTATDEGPAIERPKQERREPIPG
jgi:hypothetical protein